MSGTAPLVLRRDVDGRVSADGEDKAVFAERVVHEGKVQADARGEELVHVVEDIGNGLASVQKVDGAGPEVTQIESLCVNCEENGLTKLLLTKIPYFREVILMSFACEHCGFTNSEVQFGGVVQERGAKITLRVTSAEVPTVQFDVAGLRCTWVFLIGTIVSLMAIGFKPANHQG